MFTKALCFLAVVAYAAAGYHGSVGGGTSSVAREHDPHGYRFRYDIQDPEGSHVSQHEAGNHYGQRSGSYQVDLPHQNSRVEVDYSDDGHGLQAEIRQHNDGLSRYTSTHTGRDTYELHVQHDVPVQHHYPVHQVQTGHYGGY